MDQYGVDVSGPCPCRDLYGGVYLTWTCLVGENVPGQMVVEGVVYALDQQ